MTLRREALPPQLGASVHVAFVLAVVTMVSVAIASVSFKALATIEDEAAVAAEIPTLPAHTGIVVPASCSGLSIGCASNLPTGFVAGGEIAFVPNTLWTEPSFTIVSDGPCELFRITADGRLVFPEERVESKK